MVDHEGVKRALSNILGGWSSIETGQDTVDSPGSAVQLNGGESLPIPDVATVSVSALPDNDGNIYVGDSTVDSNTGDVLTPDTSVSLSVPDVSAIHIDADNAGQGVSWIVEVSG